MAKPNQKYLDTTTYLSAEFTSGEDVVPIVLVDPDTGEPYVPGGGGGTVTGAINGLSLDGTNVILGGSALDRATSIDGASQAFTLGTVASPLSTGNINTASGSGFVISDTQGIFEGTMSVNGFGSIITGENTSTGVSPSVFASGSLGESRITLLDGVGGEASFKANTTGLLLMNSVNNKGVKYNLASDYSSIAWAIDDDYIPSIGLIKANVFGGITSGTDNRIPIYDAAGTNIENSNIEVTLGTDGLGNDYMQSILGVHFNSSSGTDSLTSMFYGHSNAAFTNHFLKQIYNPDSLNGFELNQTFLQTSNDVVYEQRHNEDLPGPDFWNRHLFKVNGNSYLEIYRDTLGNEQPRVEVTTSAKFSVLGEGTVRSLFVADGLNQRVQVGRHNLGNADLSGNGALFTIEYSSEAGWGGDTPHLNLTGLIDSGLATLTDGDVWRDTSDSKFYAREDGSSKKIINDSINDLPDVNITTPANGEVLIYNNGTGDWENGTATPSFDISASSASYTPDSDSNDGTTLTALATNLTINAPTGTPVEGQTYVIKIKDDGTSRTLTWNAIYQDNWAGGTINTLPTATTIGKWHRLEFEYNSTDTKWDVISIREKV